MGRGVSKKGVEDMVDMVNREDDVNEHENEGRGGGDGRVPCRC